MQLLLEHNRWTYKRRDTIRKVTHTKERSFTFKIDDYPQKKRTVLLKRTMIDGVTFSHIIKGMNKFIRYDDTSQPENHYMELADRTKTSSVL